MNAAHTWDTKNPITLAPRGHGPFTAMRRSNATSFYHGVRPECLPGQGSRRDALGSTDRLTDSSQNTLVSYLYRAFGQQSVLSGSSANRFTWVGRLGYYRQPDTANCWLRARIHQPSIGRFLSLDPLRAEVNRYLYVKNRPIVMVDPGGFEGYTMIGPGGFRQTCGWYATSDPEEGIRGYWCCYCGDPAETDRRCIIKRRMQDTPVWVLKLPSPMQVVESFNVICGEMPTDECSAEFLPGHYSPSGQYRHRREPVRLKGKTGTMYPDRWGVWHCVVPCRTWNPYEPHLREWRASLMDPSGEFRGFSRRVCLNTVVFNQDQTKARQDVEDADWYWGQCCIRVGSTFGSVHARSYYIFHTGSLFGIGGDWHKFERKAREEGFRQAPYHALAFYARHIWEDGVIGENLGSLIAISRERSLDTTLAPEIGHFLGLDHYPNDSTNLMYWQTPLEPPRHRLTLNQCVGARRSRRAKRWQHCCWG